MKMLLGKDLPKDRAARVGSYDEIREDVDKMLVQVEAPFAGHYKYAFALAHSQVAKAHKAFFVVHGDLVKQPKGENGKGWKQAFRHRVIINPEILDMPPVLSTVIPGLGPKEVPAVKNAGTVPEACLSFPYRKEKNLIRYHRIRVRYQTPDGLLGGLKTRTEWVEGLAAQVFAHEVDHLNGKNIFYA